MQTHVTMKDIQKYKVLTEVLEKKLSLTDVAEVLSVSYRHAIRLKQRIEVTLRKKQR